MGGLGGKENRIPGKEPLSIMQRGNAQDPWLYNNPGCKINSRGTFFKIKFNISTSLDELHRKVNVEPLSRGSLVHSAPIGWLF